MKQYKLFQPIFFFTAVIPFIMAAMFYMLSTICGKTIGYFVSYGAYLLLLLIGIMIWRNRGKKEFQNRKVRNGVLYFCVSYIPVIATFFVAFLPTLPHISGKLLLILVPYAILNGLFEELFWRYTFVSKFGEDIIYAYIVPTLIFTCWHLALLCANGVTFQGGPLALVGGACVMGLIWGITMFKTRNVFIIISAHIAVNFFAFSQLIYDNWFA